jgi:hypothetical protein
MSLLKPFGTGATRAAGPKSCSGTSDCTPGQCKQYYFVALGDRDASCPKKTGTSRCTPTDQNSCTVRPTDPNCCDDKNKACRCAPGFTYNSQQRKKRAAPARIVMRRHNTARAEKVNASATTASACPTPTRIPTH